MATTYVERVVFLTKADASFDETGLLADSGIQGATNLAVGAAIQVEYHQYRTLSGGVYTPINGIQFTWYLTSTNDATVVSGLPGFLARWPGYVGFTWSRTLVFGT